PRRTRARRAGHGLSGKTALPLRRVAARAGRRHPAHRAGAVPMSARGLSIAVLVALATPAGAATCGGLNPILVVATPVGFGLYQPGSPGATNANGTVTVTCTVTLGASLPGFTIALSPSTTGDLVPRKMSFGTARLGYNIYTTSGYATVWGDGSAGTQTESYSA